MSSVSTVDSMRHVKARSADSLCNCNGFPIHISYASLHGPTHFAVFTEHLSRHYMYIKWCNFLIPPDLGYNRIIIFNVDIFSWRNLSYGT